MKSPILHRILSFALALCMLCTMVSGLSLTAFAVDTYTVTFSTPTGIAAPATVQVNAGSSFQLPMGIAAPDGYTFVGWYENPVSGEITLVDEDETVFKTLYLPNGDTTLFACYKRTETIPGYYQKTTGEPSTAGIKYLLVYESADKTIAFDGGKGTAASHFNVSGNYINVDVANVNGTDQIAFSAAVDAATVTIRRIAIGKFSIQLPNNKFFGINGDSTNIKLYDTAYENYLDFDVLGFVLIADTNNSTGRNFTYSTRYDKFAFYKDGSNLYLYQKVSPRTVTYYTTNPLGEEPCTHLHTELTGNVAATCTTAGHTGTLVCNDCGATLQADSVIPALGHNYGAFASNNNGTHSKTCSRCSDVVTENCSYTSETVGNTTTYTCSVCNYSYQEQSGQTGCNHNFVNNECTLCGEKFRIQSAKLVLNNQIDFVYSTAIPSGFTNPYVVFTFDGTSTTVTNYFTDEDGSLSFTFTGVNPQCMGDNLSATLFATYNGETFTVVQPTYSVRQYCVSRLKHSKDTSERALLTALLFYGTRAQQYVGYRTDAYVTSGDDLVNPVNTPFSELSGYAASFDGEADADTSWISAGLTLTNGVAMNFRFYAADTTDLLLYVTKAGRTTTYTENDFTAVTGETNVYEVTFDGINADEFSKAVYASFERDGEQIGNTISYSVNAYIQSKQNDSNKNLKNLVRALSVYCTCAVAYYQP